MCLPLLALSIDINGMGTLLPSVQRELDVPAGTVGWLVSTVSLTMAATLIPVGRLAPRIGNRRLVLWGSVVFGVASLGCGVAPTFWWLIVGRVGQGLGGVMMFTTSLAVINAAFDAPRRPAAVGGWGLVNGVGGALGPLVAGVAATISWRTFFLVNVPLCLVAFPVIYLLTPKDDLSTTHEPVPYLRLVLLGAALVALTWGFDNTSDAGWLDPWTLAALGFAVAVFVGLVGVVRRGREPLLFEGVVRSPRLFSANVVAFTANWGFGVVIVSSGVYLQVVLGKSALESGVIFTAFSVAVASAGLCISFITRRLGITGALVASMVVVALSLALGALVLTPSATLAVVTLFLLVAGFGAGLAFDVSTLAALDGVRGEASTEAAGVVSIVRSMGFTIGIALSTTLTLSVSVDASAGAVDNGTRAVFALAAIVGAIGIVGALVPNPRAQKVPSAP